MGRAPTVRRPLRVETSPAPSTKSALSSLPAPTPPPKSGVWNALRARASLSPTTSSPGSGKGHKRGGSGGSEGSGSGSEILGKVWWGRERRRARMKASIRVVGLGVAESVAESVAEMGRDKEGEEGRVEVREDSNYEYVNGERRKKAPRAVGWI
ncbi:hypothetical protein EJ06DRAFT_579845 [Trichodelitschia bisporula]|uniref:Uncharacterized protein n=1 Tax=Trichodelitschia bisporula TaxID=703511 RepID=A0A6G1I6K3_9PEZI|nr:hypothetical protein EJ06DRAFT_579845 [Trichodelitschia bisporula]